VSAGAEQAGYREELSEGELRIAFYGDWRLECCGHGCDGTAVEDALRNNPAIRRVRFDDSAANASDSALLSFVFVVARACVRLEREYDLSGLSDGTRRIAELALATRGQQVRGAPPQRGGLLERIGYATLRVLGDAREIARFVGEVVLALGRMLAGRSRMRAKDFGEALQTTTLGALPIVSLISFLVGLIISFLGAVVLRNFGAEFAVSYLVGYGMLREMGAIMTGVILCGQTGAAFAARIGSMKVNEEISALRTLGISPVDFIVLPRMLSLALSMPLLTIYANVVGILAGYLVADFMMGVPREVFFNEMVKVVAVEDFLLGLFKGGVFGVIVAGSGCLRGLQCGADANAVGVAATRAVVTGITLIIMANAVIDWAAATLGI